MWRVSGSQAIHWLFVDSSKWEGRLVLIRQLRDRWNPARPLQNFKLKNQQATESQNNVSNIEHDLLCMTLAMFETRLNAATIEMRSHGLDLLKTAPPNVGPSTVLLVPVRVPLHTTGLSTTGQLPQYCIILILGLYLTAFIPSHWPVSILSTHLMTSSHSQDSLSPP